MRSISYAIELNCEGKWVGLHSSYLHKDYIGSNKRLFYVMGMNMQYSPIELEDLRIEPRGLPSDMSDLSKITIGADKFIIDLSYLNYSEACELYRKYQIKDCDEEDFTPDDCFGIFKPFKSYLKLGDLRIVFGFDDCL